MKKVLVFLVLLAALAFNAFAVNQSVATTTPPTSTNKTMISVTVEMPDLADLVQNEERDIVREVTFDLERAMKLQTADSEPGGNKYKRGNKFHIASAPGQPPAVDSSNLLNSISTASFNDSIPQGEIILNDYGLMLEEGTGNIAPRPWIMPSLEEVLANI